MSEVVQPTQTLEQTLNKTDLGHTIFEYRKTLLVVLVLILGSTIGFVVWKQLKQSAEQQAAIQVFDFQSKVWNEAKISKLSTDDLMKSYRGLSQDVKKATLMLPLSLEMSKFLYDQNKLVEADEVLNSFQVGSGSAVTGTFIAFQRSVILEGLGKTDEAISLLETVAQNKDSILKPKLYLEIGRLALAKGDKTKAKTNFDYVISNFPNDEYAKLAKLYLAEVK